jgi:hypothetical protein
VDGVSGHEIVYSGLQVVPAGQRLYIEVSCPAGKKVVGGGFSAQNMILEGHGPASATAWQISIYNDKGVQGNAFAQAVCVVAP